MIALSSLRRKRKNKLLEILDDGAKKSLEDFALDLRKVMQYLKPIPSPNVLLTLGPKDSTPRCPTIPLRPPAYYSKSVIGLLKFHEAITEQTSLYYCAERMALAGVSTKRGAKTVGFIRQPKRFSQKGLFHYQPDALYMENTLVALKSLERNKKDYLQLSGYYK
jgi:hypothetical protein